MKKSAIVLVTLFLFALMYTSCRSHETCPAYGKVDKEINKEINS